MAHILTIQSHVVYGHAGNAAAVFPMQRLGHQVSVLNLLQFSNHTGYGSWGGKAISTEELQHVLNGLKNINVLAELDVIVSGYIGSVEQAHILYDVIVELKQQSSTFIYCCDPVMGDEGRGLYVKPDLAAFIQSHLMHVADWITPNAFELSQLSGMSVSNRTQALQACQSLLQSLPKLQGILATSVAEDKHKNTGMLLATREGVYHCETPKYDLIATVHGTGDVTTATFISHILNGDQPRIAMQKTANTLHDITQYTFEHQLRELAIIQAQKTIAEPRILYFLQHY
jgi:pyridoxine kinase